MDSNEEKKLFEKGNVIITNKRVVINSNQIQLDDIKFAFMNYDDNWKGVLISVGVGFVSFYFGIWWFGVIMLICAYFIWKNPHDELIISLKNKNLEKFLFKNRKFGRQIAEEINNTLKYTKELERENLQEEMDNLS